MTQKKSNDYWQDQPGTYKLRHVRASPFRQDTGGLGEALRAHVLGPLRVGRAHTAAEPDIRGLCRAKGRGARPAAAGACRFSKFVLLNINN